MSSFWSGCPELLRMDERLEFILHRIRIPLLDDRDDLL